MSQYQIPSDIDHDSFFLIESTTKQEQLPGPQFIVEGSSSTTINQDRALYFMAC